ncbi:MAG: enoyl-CoA hydratase/isomerase family protein [Planctomycetaceae bacterium]|nr:enoyl-CoA hydratase/isomerase family protein [Planctomycetaceae bacterium]
MLATSSVTIESRFDGAVRRVIANVPPGNIYSADVICQLQAALEAIPRDPEVRLITLEGAGAHFSYGAAVEEHTREKIVDVLPRLRELALEIACSPVPVAALIHGCCFGGAAEAVLACHFIFAANDVRFALPEIKLGVFPPYACALLPRLVGQAAADRLVLTGEPIGSRDLAELGLTTFTSKPGELHTQTDAWFRQTLGNYSASSLRIATRASRHRFLRHLERDMVEYERLYLDELMGTYDANEGIAAFIDKRKPLWRSR